MLRDPRARWWLLLGSVPVAVVLCLFSWFALATSDDSFGEIALVYAIPTLAVLAVARVPVVFRIVTVIALIGEIPLSPFAPPLLALVLIHLTALFTRRPPPLGELRARPAST